jgi:hypothetical protein
VNRAILNVEPSGLNHERRVDGLELRTVDAVEFRAEKGVLRAKCYGRIVGRGVAMAAKPRARAPARARPRRVNTERNK